MCVCHADCGTRRPSPLCCPPPPRTVTVYSPCFGPRWDLLYVIVAAPISLLLCSSPFAQGRGVRNGGFRPVSVCASGSPPLHPYSFVRGRRRRARPCFGEGPCSGTTLGRDTSVEDDLYVGTRRLSDERPRRRARRQSSAGESRDAGRARGVEVGGKRAPRGRMRGGKGEGGAGGKKRRRWRRIGWKESDLGSMSTEAYPANRPRSPAPSRIGSLGIDETLERGGLLQEYKRSVGRVRDEDLNCVSHDRERQRRRGVKGPNSPSALFVLDSF